MKKIGDIFSTIERFFTRDIWEINPAELSSRWKARFVKDIRLIMEVLKTNLILSLPSTLIWTFSSPSLFSNVPLNPSSSSSTLAAGLFCCCVPEGDDEAAGAWFVEAGAV